MNAQEQCRHAIERDRDRLRASVPSDRVAAIRALLRFRDRLPHEPGIEPLPDIVTGRPIADLGGNLALRLILEFTGSGATTSPGDALDGWAERFHEACGRLAEAGMVLMHCQTGFMRIVDDGGDTFDAWIATKRPPASWRERADIDWWAAWLSRRHASAIDTMTCDQPGKDRDDPAAEARFRRSAAAHLDPMAWQLPYPPDAVLGDLPVRTYRDILAHLIALALAAQAHGDADPWRSEHDLVADLASGLDANPVVIAQALAAFTLDRDNAGWHAAVSGIAAAPLVRAGPDRLVLSVRGLTTEPLLFLTRELRRRDTRDYHNTAVLREDVFRQDLYALFGDRRFVTSTGRIQLRRERGDLRTDIDAAVFDRKTGTLALFELKSPDPFARSAAELARQRDNVLYANRQVGGILAWVQRHGGDEILNRIDARTARTFRAQRVLPFVLGRTLVRFDDGPKPDRRAAWGTWPQLLRLLDGQPARAAEANPLASLHTRLKADTSSIQIPADAPSREIAIGAARLTVHPSYAAFQARTAHAPDRVLPGA